MNHAALRKVLGYLNLSSGTFDAQFYASVNDAFAAAAADSRAGQPAWRTLREQLDAELTAVAGQIAGFESTDQAAALVRLVFDSILPEYKKFHKDLLAHQNEEALYQPFFIAKACALALAQEGPWTETPRIVRGAVARLNDFIGHRPVVVLRTAQKIEPYRHEWVCPIPLFVAGAGVAAGRYHDMIAATLDVLRATDREVLDRASFDPHHLQELALDPRAYDFDHPANKRPNYHFGQWDPHTIDNSGRYTRFVLQAVTLDALLERVEEASGDEAAFRLQEAAVVLAGTMLMAAGVSGSGPESHDSDTTLANLLPRIAAYRDDFYRRRLAETDGPAGDRLRSEAATLRQPFAGARHDLNSRLARLRGVQLQHVRLARLFATMGNLEATTRQAQIVPVASARMLSKISGQITIGHLALERGDVAEAARLLAEVDDLLRRAIDCGAVVDPWNILGFQGQFSLFPAMENSVRDHRVDVLVHLVTRIFSLVVRTAADAAAAGQDVLLEQVLAQLNAFATWWDRFGTLEVSGVDSVSGRESVDAATAIARALGAWRQAGATGGDIAFWRKHVAEFQSPRAYALVIRTLLDKRDFLAATGLLVQWLSESEGMPLEEGEYSLRQLTLRGLKLLLPTDASVPEPSWPLVGRLFDYVEANAGDYWDVPQLAFVVNKNGGHGDNDDDDANLFQAAYEDVTYLDTTDDGTDSSLFGGSEPASDYELDLEAARLRSRLGFLRTLAQLRTMCAVASATTTTNPLAENLAAQYEHAARCEEGLAQLLTALHQYRIAEPAGTHTSLVEYDRRRRVKESLLAEVAATAVEAAAAARWIRAAASTDGEGAAANATPLPRFETLATPLLRALLEGNADAARASFPALRAEFEQQPILYVPLSRGGDPEQFVRTQSLRQLLVDLLTILPRAGLLAETCQLITVAIAMERHRPKGDRAITEFDRLFETGYRALVTAVVEAATSNEQPAADAELVETLQSLTEPLLRLWLEHSRSVRLSALEKLAEPERFKSLVEFVERYGHDLFTQKFLNPGSLRAILDQGAENYLRLLEEEPDTAQPLKLIEDLSADEPPLTRAAAAAQLQTIAEVIVENYNEYKDYNSTTTQSDHGELLYTLIDCLRLKASYERVCWNIRPIVQAHEVLMRHGQIDTAELWRRALAERTGEAADALQKQFEALGQRYQMRLPSIAARLAERFVRPLVVDGLRALVAPAIEEIRAGDPGEAFLRLESEIRELAEQPAGSGVDVPAWLAALEEEAARAQAESSDHDAAADLQARVRPVRLTLADVQRQLGE
ncbi:MAG TPA: hypothetical protein VHD36_06950 [Pirellulales bacterium]|nr:hypothetical protein [Pirellulales bacterium]